MASFNKINAFLEDVFEKKHDFSSDTQKVALTNTAPTAASDQLSTITEISYTNCSSRNLTLVTSAQSSGTYTYLPADLVLTASGGSVGPFRYIYAYNDTSTNDRGWGWWDYGSALTLADGDSITIDLTTAAFQAV